MYGYWESKKLVRILDVYYLNRKGYWGCIRCGAHNPTSRLYCGVCGNKLMPTELFSPGRPISILQNVVYALPVSRCLLFCDVAAATFEQSTTSAFTLAVALTPDANEQIEVAGGFIRCTSGTVNITLKKA